FTWLVPERDDPNLGYAHRVVALELVIHAEVGIVERQRELGGLGTLEAAARPSSLPLLLHRAVESLPVDGEPALRCEVLHEIERNAQRVVQPERVVAADDLAAARTRGAVEDLLEPRQARREHRVEAVLLAPAHLHDRIAPPP